MSRLVEKHNPLCSAKIRFKISYGNELPYREKLCRAKVTNFSFGDENFARRIVSPDKVSPNEVCEAKAKVHALE